MTSYPFDGPGYVLAHAYYPYEFDAFGGDIHFDSDENWTFDGRHSKNGVDFYNVAVHEIGHSLGLAHSSDRNSVMYPYYKSAPSFGFILGYDDILAVYEQYVSKGFGGPTKGTSTTRSSTTTVTTATTTATVTFTENTSEDWDYQSDQPFDDEKRDGMIPPVLLYYSRFGDGEPFYY